MAQPTIKRTQRKEVKPTPAGGAVLVAMGAPDRHTPPRKIAGNIAPQLAIPPEDLERWFNNPSDIEVPEILQAAILWVLTHAPTDFDPRQWAIAMGVLLDKWLLINNKPTQRLEQILTGMLPSETSREEIDAIIREAQTIIRESAADSGGNPNDPTK